MHSFSHHLAARTKRLLAGSRSNSQRYGAAALLLPCLLLLASIPALGQGIGASGSSSLGVVAPGIAEALIATAAGLFAAIPAVYFYNHLTARVKRFAAEMDDFSLEFLNIAERNFT